MTYQKNGVFSCDECPESIETDESEFRNAWNKAYAAGWRSFLGPDKLTAHACPVCVAEFAKGKKQ